MKKPRKTKRKTTRLGRLRSPAGMLKHASPVGCETWAARRLKHWGKLTDADFSFKRWAGQRRGELADRYAVRLAGACIYEYARHVDNLRGLLLMQKQFEDGPESFRGYGWIHAEKGLGPWIAFLQCLAEELAENLPWSKVSEERQDKALWVRSSGGAGTRNQIPRAASSVGGVFLDIPPVSAACDSDAQQVTTANALPYMTSVYEPGEEIPERAGLHDGIEAIAMRVNWADFTNIELGEKFAEWARRNRPPDIPEPNRMKTAWRADRSRKLLDGLAAWRLTFFEEKTLGEVAKWLAEHGCNTYPAADGKSNGGVEGNVQKLVENAGERFERWFGVRLNPAR